MNEISTPINNAIVYLNEVAFLDTAHTSEFIKSYMNENIDEEERRLLLIEIKCFEFFFQKGTLKPVLEYTDKESKRICYPDINQFNDSDVFYLKERLKSILHPFPKSRYAHILWLITKHHSFGEIAIESYRDLTVLYLQNPQKTGGTYYDFCQVLHCYHLISVTIKYKIQQCKDDIIDYLKNDHLPPEWKDNVIELMLESNLFKKKDLEGYTSFMLSIYEHNNDSYSLKEKFLKTCLLLSQKEGALTSQVYTLLAENELIQKGKREDASGMILISCYQNAAYYFKMAGNDKMYAEVMSLYTAQKSKLNLGVFQYDFPSETVKILNDEYNSIVDRMFLSTEYDPLAYLVYNKGLLMSKEKLEETAQREMKDSFMYLCSMQVYDTNNNAKSLTSDEEKFAHQQSQSYIFHLQLSTLPILEKFFYTGIKNGRITRNSVLDFLNQTWFVMAIEEFSPEIKSRTFSWIEMIGPSIYDMVAQIEAQILSNNNYIPNYILCTDSLSIKIEGIIRDLARLADISVTKIKEDEALEMNLEELLRNESVCNLFTGEDILLFKYLLTKHGWNIRNNVSHSFYRPGDYSRQKAMLLLLAVFRLCKYSDIIKA